MLVIKKALEKYMLLFEHGIQHNYYNRLGSKEYDSISGYQYIDFYIPEKDLCSTLQVTRQTLRIWWGNGYILKVKPGSGNRISYYSILSVLNFFQHQPEVKKWKLQPTFSWMRD